VKKNAGVDRPQAGGYNIVFGEVDPPVGWELASFRSRVPALTNPVNLYGRGGGVGRGLGVGVDLGVMLGVPVGVAVGV
jgi:hypothetical protein